MLAKRLATAAVMIAILVGALVYDQRFSPWYPAWFVVCMVVMTVSAGEVVMLLGETSAKPCGNTVIGGVLALLVANWAPHLSSHIGSSGLVLSIDDGVGASQVFSWPLWVFVAIVMFEFVNQSLRYREPGEIMARISGTVLAIAYVGLLGSFIVQFRWLDGPQDGLLPLILLIATAKGADTGAYTIGRIFGRHKLWPRISPKKTIEGSVGGMFFGVGAAMLVMAIARHNGHNAMSWGATAGFGLLVGSAAQVGDLMESMLKRDCARKDSARSLPGFGGMLDVVDSLLFAGPVGYGYWLCFGP